MTSDAEDRAPRAGAGDAELIDEASPSAPSAPGDADLSAEIETDIAAALVAAQRERDEYLDMVRRVQADFENYKKRMIRQQSELLERAAEGMVTTLLPVLDAFDLAHAHLQGDISPEAKALLQAAALLSETLVKQGLDRVDALGEVFDPAAHEAVEHLPAGDDGEDNNGEPVVSSVLRPGYRYKGRMIRPAMVQVRG
ncbi:MAG: nucleotide exchange factor GrpE [Acidimicrobiales bacterium]